MYIYTFILEGFFLFLYMLFLHIVSFCYIKMSYLVVNFAKEDNDKYYLINVLIFLAKVFLHKLSFKVLSHFPVFLKSYLDSLLTSNKSKALKTVSLCHLNNIFMIL